MLAIKKKNLTIEPGDACQIILEGYAHRIDTGGQPFVFAERHRRLREMARSRLAQAEKFWNKLDALPPLADEVPGDIRSALGQALPETDLPFQVVHRTSGLGSLGRQRFTAIAVWRGGRIARELKPLVAPAYGWESETGSPIKNYYAAIVAQAVRVPDPFLRVTDGWLVRRIAPDCCRIELGDLPEQRNDEKLLYAMGAETANIHLGSAQAIDVLRADLKRRPPKWLRQAATAMARDTQADFDAWRKWSKGKH